MKRQEAACPFCGASRTASLPAPPRRIRNVSRAQWLAFGSTLLGMVGCNGAVESSGGRAGLNPMPDGSTTMVTPPTSTDASSSGGQDATFASDASDETVDDAATMPPDASDSPWGPPNTSCPRHGTFVCGSTECDRATQVCDKMTGQCQPLSNAMCVFGGTGVDSGTCGACPSCDCTVPNQHTCLGQCTCFEDNFGGLTLTCSQSGCYGSPPARLDRAPLRAVS